MRKSLLLSVLVIATAALFSGCIFSPGDDPPPPPPPEPLNDTPEGAIRRLKWAYENKKGQQYEDMLAGDFTFEFSNSTDPGLVQEWSNGWFKNDEVTSARNLFQGGENLAGEFQQAADKILLTLAQYIPVDDTEGRDPVTHKVLATRVDGEIHVPNLANPSDPTIYLMGNNFNRFYIVRGDSAVGLSSTQRADSTRWYIYRWRDETATTGAPGVAPASYARAPQPVRTTLGWIKDRVR